MKLSRKYFVIYITGTFLLMITLLVLGLGQVLAGVITMIVVISWYIYNFIYPLKKMIKLLEEECNPEGFLDILIKLKEKCSENSIINQYIFDINEAVGLMALGKYELAKQIIENIDISKHSSRNSFVITYYIDLVSCRYALSEIDEANELFETKIPSYSNFNKKVKLAIESIILERYLLQDKYEEAKDKINEIKNAYKLTKRQKLHLIYSEALIDEKENNKEKAIKKYNKIIKNGNKLYLVEEAKLRLNLNMKKA
ncbi:MAG: hypothetical protein N4A63_04855 [Vallitalea sp.]|jgi:hypothetical protein|nr:hypothetical protein [Vallitalea sp.]